MGNDIDICGCKEVHKIVISSNITCQHYFFIYIENHKQNAQVKIGEQAESVLQSPRKAKIDLCANILLMSPSSQSMRIVLFAAGLRRTGHPFIARSEEDTLMPSDPES